MGADATLMPEVDLYATQLLALINGKVAAVREMVRACPAALDAFFSAVEAVGHDLPADLKRRREAREQAAATKLRNEAPETKRER